VFRKKGVEVLLLSDRVDEWLVSHLHEYKGKHLQSVTKGKLDLGDLADKEDQEKAEQAEKEHGDSAQAPEGLARRAGQEVRVSTRLVDSPACIVVGEHDMSANLARVLKAVGQDAPDMKPTLEVNLDHPLVKRLESETDEGKFNDLGMILLRPGPARRGRPAG
jgi:molecular chaperone HtpG